MNHGFVAPCNADSNYTTTTTTTTMRSVLWASLLCAVLGSTIVNAADVSTASPFKIIIDGGSTGSRLHIFEFVQATTSPDNDEIDEASSSSSITTTTTTTAAATSSCVRRGSSRANIPLSAFGRLESEVDDGVDLNATHVAQHLLPLFEYAAEVIPEEYHATTSVKYQATAGMRLLPPSEQEAVYTALYQGLMESDTFVFRGMQRSDIATLSGELEGFYGAVAANYLKGLIDTNLRLLPPSGKAATGQEQTTTMSTTAAVEDDGDFHYDDGHHGPVGALDMGGSSTQIVFLPDPSRTVTSNTCSNNYLVSDDNEGEVHDTTADQTCTLSDSSSYELNGDHFFSTSHLSYGVDQFRERLWSTLVEERVAATASLDSGDAEGSCTNKVIPNPCANKGYEVEWEGFTLIGTGDTDECIRQTKRLIPHPEVPHDDDNDEKINRVGGIQHPPVRGKFLAMSLYFFALDSLRVFSQPKKEAHEALNSSWPNPSIQELHDALDGLCSRNWHGDMDSQHGVHDFTRSEVLPHRCIETVFMVTLLKDGYGFHPSSRDITFTFLLDGDEVEWTMGMALSVNAEEQRSLSAKAARAAVPDESVNFDSNEEEADFPSCNATSKDSENEETPAPSLHELFQTSARPLVLSENTRW